MQDDLSIEAPATEAKAWHVGFSPVVRAGVVEIAAPRRLFAQWTAIDSAVPPVLARAEGEVDRSLAVLWLPPGAASDIEKAWLAGLPAPHAGERIVRAGLRTARVVWTNRRILVYAAREQLEEALDAVLRFTVAERDMAALEAGMTAAWASIDAHVPLTHTVLPADYGEHAAEVRKTTEVVTKMAGSALRIERAIEQSDPSLGPASRRLFAELVLQAGLEDRLEMLAEPIDFAIEHYELINSRMAETKQFMLGQQQFQVEKKQFEAAKKQGTASFVAEVVILAVLVADLLWVAYPYIKNWAH